ncbi:DUF3618 domain-containing protein [Jiella pacifica]|uniref:DUF3618 domain-containing protein n=1 Tax=Jiella pacifica TaxID=2696469 RepID=A0A6N9T8P7_9HYPH|nr:DUF3618 domain-containing protein [Jiella pacifica]NDW07804.1 DUF3618 domain-containing protein [Jiella pacifica]|tara:strand:+ start:50 stop:1078 length:1029 start_codon:yes stop_codon:yes gene_type:complete
MSTDTDRLEREAESHRANLDSTFDALRDRLSVGQIVDEVSGYLKEGQGADTVKNLGRQVRDNPLALGLVGAGLAWLLLGDGARGKGQEMSDRYTRWREDREYDRFDEAFPPHDGDVTDDRSAPSRQYVGSSTTTSKGTGSTGPGIGSKVADAASSVGAAGSSAASSVSESAKTAGQSVSDAASSAGDAARRGFHDASDSVSHASSTAMHSARRTGRSAYRAGARAQRNVADLIHDEPLVFGAIALAIGAAVGALLPATRTEDEWMGETRDHLRDDAYEQGRETLHKAENVAAKTYEAVSEEAEGTGLKPKSSQDETIAERVSDVVKAGKNAAKTEVKKEGLS